MGIPGKAYRATREEKTRIRAALAAALEARPEIRFAWLHGSFLGDLAFHDIDVAVITAGRPDNPLLQAAQLAGALGELAAYPVDVRIVNEAPVSFLFSVIRGEILVDRDPEERCRFAEEVARRYLDIKPILVQATREAFGRAP
ncbi:MAG: nucleotidyltransferase domain-containing protein [Thermodesulfobacteriota bacterium]